MKAQGWKELYPSVRLKPKSGFEFVELQYNATTEDYLDLLKTIGISAEEIEKERAGIIEEPKFPLQIWKVPHPSTSPDKVYPLLRYYLSENATSTFAIAQRNGWGEIGTSAQFFIAFRNPKDTFVFLLKFPKAKRIRLIQRNLSYYVRVASDDNTDMSAVIETLDETDQAKWNKEDPQGLL